MKSKKQIFRDFERKAARKFETRALPDLIEQRNNLVEEMENIIKDAEKETRALTDDETSRFDEIKKEIDGIDKTLKAQNEAKSNQIMRLEEDLDKKNSEADDVMKKIEAVLGR